MKVIRKLFVIALPIAVLAGCANLEQTVQQIQKATAPVAIEQTLPQICQAAKENKVRANGLYVHKMLSISGEVRSIKEGFQPRYRVYLRSGNISIHAGTENTSVANSLTTGRTVRASGVVTDVDFDYNGCSITIKDATF
jgi:hypothetical protein